eukprot:884891-Prymnesium_polylepis.1
MVSWETHDTTVRRLCCVTLRTSNPHTSTAPAVKREEERLSPHAWRTCRGRAQIRTLHVKEPAE